MKPSWNDGVAAGIAIQIAPLLRLGQPSKREFEVWPDYAARYDLGKQHEAALIRMACDPALQLEAAGKHAIWAPVHAWRALGQLRAEAAVAPLLALMADQEADDTSDMELPRVFGLIGPAAIPPIVAFLTDSARDAETAATAMAGLVEIAEQFPDSRDACIAHIEAMLAAGEPHDPALAGFAIAALIDALAIDSMAVIRDAFQRDAVDISICGDLEDVEIDMGLRETRSTPKPRYQDMYPDYAPPDDEPPPPTFVRDGPKIGRNDPCLCGSGKKYKKCCLV